MRPGTRWKLWMVVVQQMRAGLWQCSHLPLTAQGVAQLRRTVLAGAAMASTRSFAAARSFTILLQPTTSSTFSGPKVMAATRLELPSTL